MSLAERSRTEIQVGPPASRPAVVRIPTSAATLDGFRAWITSDEFPERTRATFLGTEILIDMSPEEFETHVVVKYEVARVLLNLIREQRIGRFYGDGSLVTNEGADLSTEPDGTFVTFDTFRSGRARLIPREGYPGQFLELEGTPDWVLEVISLSSVRRDSVVLRDAYYRAGVPEYWVIDARAETIDLHILLHDAEGYAEVVPNDSWSCSRVFNREFRLDRTPDELGLWDYTLHVREPSR